MADKALKVALLEACAARNRAGELVAENIRLRAELMQARRQIQQQQQALAAAQQALHAVSIAHAEKENRPRIGFC